MVVVELMTIVFRRMLFWLLLLCCGFTRRRFDPGDLLFLSMVPPCGVVESWSRCRATDATIHRICECTGWRGVVVVKSNCVCLLDDSWDTAVVDPAQNEQQENSHGFIAHRVV